MEKIWLLLIICFVFSNAFSLTVELSNNKKIEGKFLQYKDSKLKIAVDRTIYTINNEFILKIYDSGIEINKESLLMRKQETINYNKYSDFIEINSKTKLPINNSANSLKNRQNSNAKINSMNEREFQFYLTNIKLEQERKTTKEIRGVKNAIWGTFFVGIGLGVAAALIFG